MTGIYAYPLSIWVLAGLVIGIIAAGLGAALSEWQHRRKSK